MENYFFNVKLFDWNYLHLTAQTKENYFNRKVWYHQIWIPNNLDFMVLILMYVPTSFVCIVFKSEVNGVKVHLDLDIHFWSRKYFCWNEKPCICKAFGKVIYAKYSKHWPYTVAHTIDCVCNKMLNHGLNHGLFLALFKFFGWKLNKFRIKNTRLLYCFRSQVFTWNVRYSARNHLILICLNGCAD